MTIRELERKTNYIRDEVIRVAVANKAGHIASSLSTVDILVALYYRIMQPYKLQANSFMITNSQYDLSEYIDRDRLVLSKGHGCYALYAILADLGILPRTEWELVGSLDHIKYPPNVLRGCVEYMPNWGLEASTGSLGHGLPIAVGMAYAEKLLKKNYHIYCILGDGECQEGTTWESAEFAFRHNLSNICVIVDANKKQAMSDTPYDRYEIAGRFEAFGWDTTICKGHDMVDIIHVLQLAKEGNNPYCIVADTIKGYGLKCMENVTHFHYRVPTEEELRMGKTYK